MTEPVSIQITSDDDFRKRASLGGCRAIRSAEVQAAGPERAAWMLRSGVARAGRPLHADPQGPMPKPKAPQSGARTARQPPRLALIHRNSSNSSLASNLATHAEKESDKKNHHPEGRWLFQTCH